MMQALVEHVEIVESAAFVALRSPENDDVDSDGATDFARALAPRSFGERPNVRITAVVPARGLHPDQPLILEKRFQRALERFRLRVVVAQPLQAGLFQTARLQLIDCT